MKRILILLSLILISGCCKEELEDIVIIDPEPPVDVTLGNYGYPNYSYINQSTGKNVFNRVSSGRFLSREEMEEKINIHNGETEVYLLGDQSYALFDYDGDGDLDLFGWMVNISPATSIGYVSGPGRWVWWPNYEDVNSTPTYFESPIWFAAGFEINDFNGDGILELLWQNSNHHSDGNGGYYTDHYPLVITYLSENNITEVTVGDPTSVHDIATGDLDNDGDIDIISPEWKYGSFDHISVPIFHFNDGNGNFTTSNTNLAESVEFLNHNSRSDMIFTSIAAFDVNGDNYLDIISGYSNGNTPDQGQVSLYDSTNYRPNDIQVWYGDGSGDFSLNNGFHIPITTPIEATLANINTSSQLGSNFVDLDYDGFPEMVMIETYNYAGWGIKVYKNLNGQGWMDKTSYYITNPVQMHSGANGPFSQQQPGDVGMSYDLQIIDIDNDGDFDLMPSFPSHEDIASTTRVAYWKNNGGTFTLVKLDN
jgi:hypothetical protein